MGSDIIAKIKPYIIGLIAGFVNGLFGSGGGALVVCAMEKLLGIKAQKAHATAIAIILPLSIISALFYIRKLDFEIMPILYVSAGGMLGGFLGAKILSKIKSGLLNKVFGVIMIISALQMIF